MIYPSMEEVEAANHEMICYWWRFLPSPGLGALDATPDDRDAFNKALAREAAVMDRIGERLKAFGGFTPQISKSIGWEKP